MAKKSNHPEASLRKGSLPSGNALDAFGLSQGSNETPEAESNVESLRHGRFSGKGEKIVQHVPHNQGALKKAHAFNKRSQNGGANKMAVTGPSK